MKTAQKGFTAIEGLLITIIILMVGFIGYYVYHSQQQTDKTLNNAQSDNKSSAAVKASGVKDFADCQKAAGSITQQSYPEVCTTKSGQRFTQ